MNPIRVEHGGIRVGSDGCSIDGRPVHLAPTERRLLHFLVAHHGKPLSAYEIIWSVWPKTVDPKTVSTYCNRVRSVLRREKRGHLLKTVRGYGYCFGGEV